MSLLPDGLLNNLPNLNSLNLVGTKVDPCDPVTSINTTTFFSNTNVCYQSDANCDGNENRTQQFVFNYKDNGDTDDCKFTKKDYSTCDITPAANLNHTELITELENILKIGMNVTDNTGFTGHTLLFDSKNSQNVTQNVKVSVLRSDEQSDYWSVFADNGQNVVVSSTLNGFTGSHNSTVAARLLFDELNGSFQNMTVENLQKRTQNDACSL